MALPLSPNIAKAVDKLFTDEHKEEAIRLLIEQYHENENLPCFKNQDEYDLEDFRFQILKLSEGNIEKLRDAIRLANTDFREISGAVGSVRKYKHKLLGNAIESNIKLRGYWYIQVWNIIGFFVTFTAFLILKLYDASILLVATFLSIAVIDAVIMLIISRLCGIMRDFWKYIFIAPLRFFFPSALGYLTASLIRLFS